MPSAHAPKHLSAALLLSLAALVGCGTEEPPRLTDAGPRRAEISHPQRERTVRPGEAVLAASGRQTFEGPAAFRCVLHDETGLQVNFRTRDSDMPAVAVRIEDFEGAGPYRARLFVTGRSRTGALVTSMGEANVQVQERTGPEGRPVAFLSGSFEGDYTGQAGKGSVEGRFGTCSYPAARESRGGAAAGVAGGP